MLGQFPEGLAKNKEEGAFEGEGVDIWMHTMTWFWYMPELKIGLADVSALNFDQSFLQFNTKKKINAKKSSRFEFKCWILKTATYNLSKITCKTWSEYWTYQFPNTYE